MNDIPTATDIARSLVDKYGERAGEVARKRMKRRSPYSLARRPVWANPRITSPLSVRRVQHWEWIVYREGTPVFRERTREAARRVLAMLKGKRSAAGLPASKAM